MNRLMVEQAGSRFFELASSLGRIHADTLTGLADATAKTPLGPVFAVNASVARMVNEGVDTLAQRFTGESGSIPDAPFAAKEKAVKPKATPKPAKKAAKASKKIEAEATAPLALEPEAHDVLVEDVAMADIAPAAKIEEITAADDLTVISGIGATTAKKLNGAGVTRFADIAAMNEGAFADLLASLDIKSIRFSPAKWIEEAKTFSVKN